MSDAKHTPEKWVAESNSIVANVDTRHFAPIAETFSRGEVSGTISVRLDAEANARRIVAAVNAVAGIPTEALEAGVVKELVGALRISAECLEKWHLVPDVTKVARAALKKAGQ